MSNQPNAGLSTSVTGVDEVEERSGQSLPRPLRPLPLSRGPGRHDERPAAGVRSLCLREPEEHPGDRGRGLAGEKHAAIRIRSVVDLSQTTTRNDAESGKAVDRPDLVAKAGILADRAPLRTRSPTSPGIEPAPQLPLAREVDAGLIAWFQRHLRTEGRGDWQ